MPSLGFLWSISILMGTLWKAKWRRQKKKTKRYLDGNRQQETKLPKKSSQGKQERTLLYLQVGFLHPILFYICSYLNTRAIKLEACYITLTSEMCEILQYQLLAFLVVMSTLSRAQKNLYYVGFLVNFLLFQIYIFFRNMQNDLLPWFQHVSKDWMMVASDNRTTYI